MTFIWESRVRYFLLLFFLCIPVSAFSDTSKQQWIKETELEIRKVKTGNYYLNPEIVQNEYDPEGIFLKKWIEACENNKTRKNKTEGVLENVAVYIGGGVNMLQCKVKSCKDNYYPNIDSDECIEKRNCDYINDVDDFAKVITDKADNIKVGDTIEYNDYYMSFPKIKDAWLYWQKKCLEIANVNGITDVEEANIIYQGTGDTRCEPNKRLKCIIKTCDTGYVVNGNLTKCLPKEQELKVVEQMTADINKIIDAYEKSFEKIKQGQRK